MTVCAENQIRVHLCKNYKMLQRYYVLLLLLLPVHLGVSEDAPDVGHLQKFTDLVIRMGDSTTLICRQSTL